MAQVLSRYLPGTKVLESAALKGVPVAVVVPAGWEPAEPTSGSPAAQCPEA
jgi:hypothetical protein